MFAGTALLEKVHIENFLSLRDVKLAAKAFDRAGGS